MIPIANTRSASGMATGLLAVWWLVASEIVIFGGILCSYIMHRLTHDAWAIQSANTNTTIGAINTFVLLTSSLTAVLARCLRSRNSPAATLAGQYFSSAC